MEYEARRFARKVIFIHAALLLILLGGVGAAGWFLYQNSWNLALIQATNTQELLAKQTALGVQNYYESVTGVLNLLQPEGEAPQSPPPPGAQQQQQPGALQAAPPGGGQHRQRNGPLDRRARRGELERGPLRGLELIGARIWKSIKDKSSLLFIVDREDDMSIVSVLGKTEGAEDAEDVMKNSRAWLAQVTQRAVSGYVTLKSGSAHLVCVPLRNENLLMVAVVPVSLLERDVLHYVNRSRTTSAMLVDDKGNFISAESNPAVVGHNISEMPSERTRQIADKYLSTRQRGTEVFREWTQVGNEWLKPGMTTVEPVDVLGRTWFVSVSSDLTEVDKVIKPVFKDVAAWAIAVAIIVLGIIASTSYQLIRSRLKLDRMKHEVMEKEIEDAREIQLHWLPKSKCGCGGVDIAAVNMPATHISGDFYDWFELDDDRIVVTIGDVTGHGMAAAFLMATTQLLVRNVMHQTGDPGACLQEVNRQLCTQTFNGQFVTMLILVIDPNRCSIEVATAGHHPPLIGSDGAFRVLDVEPRLVLGVEREEEFPSQRFELPTGSSLLLFTDGASDVQAPDGERFSNEGLCASLYGRYESAEAILSAVRAAVEDFRRGRDLADDLTLVGIQLEPALAPTQEHVVNV